MTIIYVLLVLLVVMQGTAIPILDDLTIYGFTYIIVHIFRVPTINDFINGKMCIIIDADGRVCSNGDHYLE